MCVLEYPPKQGAPTEGFKQNWLFPRAVPEAGARLGTSYGPGWQNTASNRLGQEKFFRNFRVSDPQTRVFRIFMDFHDFHDFWWFFGGFSCFSVYLVRNPTKTGFLLFPSKFPIQPKNWSQTGTAGQRSKNSIFEGFPGRISSVSGLRA